MKALAALAVLVGAGLVAGTAVGDPIPIPPVTTVTVSLPPPPVPLPPAPASPEPVVTTTASAPVSSTLSQASQIASSSSSGGSLLGSSSGSSSSSSSSGSSSSSSSGSGGTTGGSAGSARVNHFQSSRPWIGTTGPKKRRTTTFTFVLPSPARVIFTVTQVSPACVGIGHFRVAGHAGLNRVRFAGRVHGRQLAPGTYRIAARTAAGRLVRRITLVVVSGSGPTRAELTALRAANACSAAAGEAAATSGSSAQLPKPLAEAEERAAGIAPQAPNLHTGVLGSAVQNTARAIQPLLVALLALAILLLAVASLPRLAVPDPRVNELLARHRIEIAALGAAALVGVALAFLLA